MNKAYRYLVTILFTLAIGCVFAQLPPDPDDDDFCDDPFTPEDECIPIDGGLTFLAAAGAAFGGYKLKGKKKDK